GADDARLLPDGIVVVDGAADDDLAVDDDRRRGGIVVAGGAVFHSLFEVQFALVGKGGADLAVRRVERDEAGIGGGKIDPRATGLAGRGRFVLVISDAAAGLVLTIRIHAG